MRSNTYLRLESIYNKYNGYVGTKVLMGEGFSNRQIAVLEAEGYLEKVCHGYYWFAGRQGTKPADYKCIEVCLSDPRAVVCMDSAIYYQGRIEEEPEYLSVATKRSDRSLLKMNFPIKRHYFSDHYFETGIRRRDTEFGCYNIYDVERSICDMVRLEEKIEMKILNGVKNNAQQYARVMKYAELLKVKGRILN